MASGYFFRQYSSRMWGSFMGPEILFISILRLIFIKGVFPVELSSLGGGGPCSRDISFHHFNSASTRALSFASCLWIQFYGRSITLNEIKSLYKHNISCWFFAKIYDWTNIFWQVTIPDLTHRLSQFSKIAFWVTVFFVCVFFKK